jgi:hypothetical protein
LLQQQCACCVDCRCPMSISAFMPLTATASLLRGTVVSRAGSCNCAIDNYPFHFIGPLCTESGIVVSVTYTASTFGFGNMRSPPIPITTLGPCGTTTSNINCGNLNAGFPPPVNCGALGWPYEITEFTLADFSHFSGPTYDEFPIKGYFPDWIKVFPSFNPLP